MNKSVTFSELAEWNERRRRCVLSWWREDTLASPEGWSLSKANPALLLECFPELQLKAGTRLCAYQFRQGDSGNGLVMALPAGVSPLDRLPKTNTPQRASSHDLMQAIQGDGAAQSYFAASLFWRECCELGAQGHGIEWMDHHLLTNDCWNRPGDPALGYNHEPLQLERQAWLWRREPPREFAPTLTISGSGAGPLLTFFTYHGGSGARIVRHEDQFSAQGYSFQSREETVASETGLTRPGANVRRGPK